MPITHEKPAAIPQMSTSNEVVKAALSEGIRARQVVLDQHVDNLVEIGKPILPSSDGSGKYSISPFAAGSQGENKSAT